MSDRLESIVQAWGGEELVVRYDAPSGAWILIGIHSTRLGPAVGGTRMKTYPSLADAVLDVTRLSEGMTYKYAVQNFPKGGGKAVIALPPDFDPARRTELLYRYGRLVHDLGGLFATGPDVGTSTPEIDIIAETGAPYVFCRSPEHGGAGDSGPLTAVGVLSGIEAVCAHLYGTDSLESRRIVVQGVGGVGGRLVRLLCDRGAQVSFTDVNAEAARRVQQATGARFVPPEQVYEVECELFSPCALGGILNADSIPRLRCKGIAGAANNQLAGPGDAERLRARGILYAPDYVTNSGGAIGITGIEGMGWSLEEAETRVKALKGILQRVFETASAEQISTEAAARRIAEANLAAVRA